MLFNIGFCAQSHPAPICVSGSCNKHSTTAAAAQRRWLPGPLAAFVGCRASSSSSSSRLGSRRSSKGSGGGSGSIVRVTMGQQQQQQQQQQQRQSAGAPVQALRITEGSRLQGPPAGDGTVLFTHMLCPYAQRVLLTLLEKGADFEAVHIDLSAKPAWYLKLNPRGLVPAVRHGGKVIVESIDICRWADGALEGPPLMPSDPGARQAADSLIAACGGFVSAGLALSAGRTGRYWGIGTGQGGGDVKGFERELAKLQRALGESGGPYLCGADVSLADLIFLPFAERFDLIARRFAKYDLRAYGDGSVGRWLDTVAARPAAVAAAADASLLQRAYEKHMSLDFFDYDTYAAFSLHPHLKNSA